MRFTSLFSKLAPLVLAASGSLFAAPMLTLTPDPLLGLAGQTVGWSFTLTADDTYWISAVTSFLDAETNPLLGFYTDNLGPQGGPVNFSLAPNSPAWTQSFDQSLGTGAGLYFIDGSAPTGATNTGTLIVSFDLFSGDPTTCGSCQVGSGSASAAFTVAVTDTPEPGTAPLVVIGLLLTALGYRKSL